MKRGELGRELMEALSLVVAVALSIPVPSSTPGPYPPTPELILLQTALFAFSRWCSRGNDYPWLTAFEAFAFCAIAYVSALASTVL